MYNRRKKEEKEDPRTDMEKSHDIQYERLILILSQRICPDEIKEHRDPDQKWLDKIAIFTDTPHCFIGIPGKEDDSF
jgi:hypothetical protein